AGADHVQGRAFQMAHRSRAAGGASGSARDRAGAHRRVRRFQPAVGYERTADAALLAAAGERLLVPRFRSSHHSAARFSEDRDPLFGIMLVLKRTPTASARRHTTRQRRWTFARLASTRMNSSGTPARPRGGTARRA